MTGRIQRLVVVWLVTLMFVGTAAWAQTPTVGADQRPTFKTGVDLVSVSAVVRDRRGQVVRNLSREDFVIIDNGVRRPIVEFSPAEDGPVSIALLFDISGSMAMASSLSAGRRAIEHLLSWFNPGVDEIALFAFDKRLYELEPFTADPVKLRASLDRLGAFGMTSLYDAVAQVAGRLRERPTRRRAIVVLTDGLDNSSRLTAPEVSGIASATDVPVYVIAVVSPLDHAGEPGALTVSPQVEASTALTNLAWWTGGNSFVVSTDAHASIAARSLLAELRHQYILAFESSGGSGWRPLDIRLRRRELTVRARSGYFSSAAASGRPLGE